MEREQTTIRLPAKLKEELQQEAAELEQTFTEIIQLKGTDKRDTQKELREFLMDLDERLCTLISELNH